MCIRDRYYKAFVRSGAGLDAGKQSRLREINKELSTLGIAFDNHILNENNAISWLSRMRLIWPGYPNG